MLGEERPAVSLRRADKAAEVAMLLLRQGNYVDIIVTGTMTETTSISSRIRAQLGHAGAPSYRLHLDFSARNTRNNFRNSEAIMKAMHMSDSTELHIVTSRFHMVRTMGIWKESGRSFKMHLSEDPFGLLVARTPIEVVSAFLPALGIEGGAQNRALSRLKAMLYQGETQNRRSEQAVARQQGKHR